MSATHERIIFRLFAFPCCGFQLCWVNPRMPSYCPECGETTSGGQKLKDRILLQDNGAWIKTDLDVALKGATLTEKSLDKEPSR